MTINITFRHPLDKERLCQAIKPSTYLDDERVRLEAKILSLEEEVRITMVGGIGDALYLVAKCWEFAPFELSVGG